MKRFAAFFIVCIIFVGTVSAEVSVRGSMYAFWDAFQYVEPAPDGSDPQYLSGFGRPGGSSMQGILEFNGQLESRKAGFRAQVSYDGGTSVGISDNLLLWVRPFDWMRVDVGKMMINDMQHKFVYFYPILDTFMLTAGRDDDIFTNYEANNSILLRLTPVKNLFIGAFLYNQALLSQGENAAARPFIGAEDFVNAIQRIQATAAYTIPNVGLARIQYVGVNPHLGLSGSVYNGITAPRIEAAFAYTGLPNLTVDLGVKYVPRLEDPTVTTNPTAGRPVTATAERPGLFQAPQQVSLAAQYDWKNLGPGTLTVQGRVDTKFWGYYQTPGKNIMRMGPEVKVSFWPSYRMGDWTFQAETTMVYADNWTKYGRTVYTGGFGYSFGAFAQRNFAGGTSVLVGIAWSGGEGIVWPGNATHETLATQSTATEAGKLPSVLSIPVKFSVYF